MNKKKYFKLNKLYALMVLLSAPNAFAANFNIAPYGALPTTVTTGQTVPAYFTVTNMTNAARNGYVVKGLPATVTQNTGGAGSCSNPINLGPYPANCQLQLDITGAVSSNFAICKGNSCTTATTPLNVSERNVTTPRFAYVTQANDSTNPSVIICPVDSTTGFLTGSGCVSAGGGLSNIAPQGIQISSDGSTAYITTGRTSDAYQCPINSTTGQFGTCTSTALTVNAGGSYVGVFGFLALNSSNTLAYIVANYSDVIACPVTGNTIQSSCTNTGATNIQFYGVGITLNANNRVAYIGNYNDSSYSVTTCAVSGDSFTACGNKTGGGTITFSGYGLQGVALNNTGTIVYLTDFNNSAVYGCDATSDTAATTFNNCFLASNVPAWGITLNAAGTMAYVTDYNTTVYACPISPVDGTFTSCTPTTGLTFQAPVDIALLY